MVATPSTLYERLDLKDTEREMIMPTEPIRPVIYKWNQRAAYRRLSIPSIVSCQFSSFISSFGCVL